MISKLLKKNEKGFTLMEMLIVVAIIAVLVAIAIPTFTSSLNKARVATDAANIRAGYASVMLNILQDETAGNVTATTTYWLMADGSVKASATAPTTGTLYTCKTGSPDGASVAGLSVTWTKDGNVKYVYTPADGTNPSKVEINPTNP